MEQPHFGLGTILALIYIFLPILLGWIQISYKKHSHRAKIELFLIYYLVIGVGFSGLLSGYLHIFHPTFVSNLFGWAESPFTQQVGMASLGFAALGIGSIWLADWRSATGVGFTIFAWLAAVGRLYAGGRPSAFFWSDVLVPLAILILLGLRHRHGQKTN